MPPSQNDPLSRALAEWRVAPPRDPQFRARVRDRIGSRRGAASWPRYVRSHASLVASALALALLVGAWSGRNQARARVEAERDRLATSYVEGLDARLMRMK